MFLPKASQPIKHILASHPRQHQTTSLTHAPFHRAHEHNAIGHHDVFSFSTPRCLLGDAERKKPRFISHAAGHACRAGPRAQTQLCACELTHGLDLFYSINRAGRAGLAASRGLLKRSSRLLLHMAAVVPVDGVVRRNRRVAFLRHIVLSLVFGGLLADTIPTALFSVIFPFSVAFLNLSLLASQFPSSCVIEPVLHILSFIRDPSLSSFPDRSTGAFREQRSF